MATRRSLLSALPAVTLPMAGCLTPPGGDGPDRPSLRIVARDDQPSHPLEIAVRVTRPDATESHPPGIHTAVTNTSDETVEVGEARAVVFAFQYSADGALMLLPAGGDYPADPGCWRLTEGIAVTEEYRIRSLAPDETMEASLSLYASTENPEGTCFPLGEHRFESRYSLHPTGDDERRFTWGFTVSLD